MMSKAYTQNPLTAKMINEKSSRKGQFVENKLLNLLIYIMLLLVLLGIYAGFKDSSISVWKGLSNLIR